MSRVSGAEVNLVSGEGCFVEDDGGRRYLDASAGLWYCNVGHGRREIADAVHRQMTSLAAYQTFDVFANPPALALAERVAALAPVDGDAVVFFTNGGSDAVDTAGKIVRRYWSLRGRPERTTVVARGGAYHGMNAYGTSLAGIEANAAGWGPLVREVVHVPAHDVGAVAELFEQRGSTIGAFIGEPVIGAGGVHPPVDDYWPQIADLCREHDVLLIADEVVTGFGRLGRWFASQRFGVTPDLVLTAKGITSGYLPLGAVLCGERVRQTMWAGDAGPFRHGYTYSGHPSACAAAMANLDIIEREGLVERVGALEPVLEAALAPLSAHPLVAEVRSAGLLAAVELDAEALRQRPGLVDDVVRDAREAGVLVRGLIGRSLQISPPFVITETEIAQIAAALRAALDAAADRRPAGAEAR
ncbi:MAG TPA: aspartate aminotransferase family protein [Baekduia sp.]|uniref:aminotransferase family protein n=1 Tax=Baekduia sp. TaxID=2600305 RepID=UPI002BA334C1|nr:aspartate aminotransferase family protein [Baekduia sp.]HMJ34483.1 aspartate aminotransferase family protein [Baekduia sp.]